MSSETRSVSFKSKVDLNGKTATGIQVPEAIVEELGSKRPAVHVTLNGYSYRSTIARMGGRYLLPLSGAHREASGIAAGDTVEVTLRPDTAPREVQVPRDLEAALAAHPGAREAFQALSNSRKKRLTLPISDAKTEETRKRRVDKAVAAILSGTA